MPGCSREFWPGWIEPLLCIEKDLGIVGIDGGRNMPLFGGSVPGIIMVVPTGTPPKLPGGIIMVWGPWEENEPGIGGGPGIEVIRCPLASGPLEITCGSKEPGALLPQGRV